MGFWGLNPGPDSPVLLSLPTPPALHPGLLSASEYTDLLDSPCISFRTLSPTFTWSSLFISNSTRTRPATLLKGCGSTRNHPAYRTPRIYSPFFIEKLALLGSRAWFLEPQMLLLKVSSSPSWPWASHFGLQVRASVHTSVTLVNSKMSLRYQLCSRFLVLGFCTCLWFCLMDPKAHLQGLRWWNPSTSIQSDIPLMCMAPFVCSSFIYSLSVLNLHSMKMFSTLQTPSLGANKTFSRGWKNKTNNKCQDWVAVPQKGNGSSDIFVLLFRWNGIFSFGVSLIFLWVCDDRVYLQVFFSCSC